MKSYTAILSAMLAASVLLSGCGSTQTESSAPESSSQSSSETESSPAQIPNPIQPIKTAAELADRGFDIVLPAKAEEIEYSVINDTIAQARFTLSGHDWTLRTGQADEDTSGLHGERTSLSPLQETAHDGSAVTIQIESVDTGEELPRLCASWELNGARYTLETSTEDETTFRESCSTIIGYLDGKAAATPESSSEAETESNE